MLHAFGVRLLSAWLSCTVTIVFSCQHADHFNRGAQAVSRSFSSCALPGWVSPSDFAAEDTTVPTAPLTKTFLFIVFLAKPNTAPECCESQQDHWPAPASLPQPQQRDLWGWDKSREQLLIWASPSEVPACALTLSCTWCQCLCGRKSLLVSTCGSVRALLSKSTSWQPKFSPCRWFPTALVRVTLFSVAVFILSPSETPVNLTNAPNCGPRFCSTVLLWLHCA